MMKKNLLLTLLLLALLVPMGIMIMAMSFVGPANTPARPQGPCDIYGAGGTPCVAAHSTTRALYASYHGPLYQVMRKSDGKTQDIGIMSTGFANAASQDAFCNNTLCYITKIYDQSGKGNHLVEAPPGTFKGPAKGQYNNLPIADMAPLSVNGHKAYGVYIIPGMGFRNNNAMDIAINDEPEGIYYVIDGKHYDSGCCFDYGNASTSGKAVGTGTMETTYFGISTAWGSGNGAGPWIMSDMEAGLFSGYNAKKNEVPSIDSWKFVTAFVDGGSGNKWDLRGGDAQKGGLITFYEGVRPGTPASTAYSPMSKKGAILLGNGGDNGNGSAGTFYEGVMTTGYPTMATTDAVQANVVTARYDVQPVSLSRITTFMPKSTQDVIVTFTNTTGATLKGVNLGLTARAGWSISLPGSAIASKAFASIAAGASVSVDFNVTSPATNDAGYITGKASWGAAQSEMIAQRIRSAPPVKINEVRLTTGSNATNQFVELYNASAQAVDISKWTIINTQSGWAPVTLATIPAGTKIAGHGFYLLGLATSGLLAPAKAGDNVLTVQSTTGIEVGQQINIDGELHKIANVGTAATAPTTLYIPVSTSSRLIMPAGSTNIPVTNAAGFSVGQKIGIDMGGNYEIATVTSVGKAGTQATLFEAAKAGSTTIKVTDNANMSVGETLTINTGARKETFKVKRIVNVVTAPARGIGAPGEVELTEPLKLNHMNGVDVYGQGTGISFVPATRFIHHSGDAVQALGSGITLEGKLSKNHDAGTAIISSQTTATGYQGDKKPNQWFGIPLSSTAGSIALNTANGLVLVDAMVYGSQQSNSSGNGTVTSPELATLEGVQSQGGSQVVVQGAGRGISRTGNQSNKSYGRYPDGYDSDNNFNDFMIQNDAMLAIAADEGSNNIKVSAVADFRVGQKIIIGSGNNKETALIAAVGTAGGTTVAIVAEVGATVLSVGSITGFEAGQTITIGNGTNHETAVITGVTPGRRGPGVSVSGTSSSITVSSPLKYAHAIDVPVAGTGITLTNALGKAHESGAQVISNVPTPGEPNQYTKKP